jgi:hypothetical protein
MIIKFLKLLYNYYITTKDINSNNFGISNNSNSNGLFKTGFGFGLGNPVNN